jgi:hypothetical protein
MRWIRGFVAPLAGGFLALVTARAAHAQEAPPKELVQLRAAFAAAVEARDIKALEGLSRFPLNNQAYGSPDKISRAEFTAYVFVNGYWDKAECLRTAPLERDVREGKDKALWFVACDGGKHAFHFAREGGRWVYSGFESRGD